MFHLSKIVRKLLCVLIIECFHVFVKKKKKKHAAVDVFFLIRVAYNLIFTKIFFTGAETPSTRIPGR